MFRGQYDHTIDDKGRLSIPAKLREALGKDRTLVLTSFEAFITVFPMKAWRNMEERIRNNPTFKRDMRDFLRLVYSSAEDVEIDPQGRILISQGLRQRAGISRDVVILGVMDQIEIWDKARWEEKVRSAPPAEELTAKMGELGV
jgi:transcriptional regulator MraZ